MPSRPRARRPAAPARLILAVRALAAGLAVPALLATSAAAHGFSSVVYVEASGRGADTIRTVVALEYDLLVSSVAQYEGPAEFYQDGMDVWQTRDEASALNAYDEAIVAYVTKRFAVTAGGASCDPSRRASSPRPSATACPTRC